MPHLLIALILFAGAVVQSAVGFGMGLFAIPLLMWSGLSLPAAVGSILPCIILQSLLNCWQHRRHLPWREAVPMTGWRLLGLLPGLWVMYELNAAGGAKTKQVVGAAVLLALLSQRIWRIQPQRQLRKCWTIVAGILSGFFAGAVGMGGPPLVLYVIAHDRPTAWQRSFLWLLFLMILPVQIPLLINTFGSDVVNALLTGLSFSPVALLGAWAGDRVGRLLSRSRLRLAMTIVLLGISLHSLFSPMLLDDQHSGPPRTSNETTR